MITAAYDFTFVSAPVAGALPLRVVYFTFGFGFAERAARSALRGNLRSEGLRYDFSVPHNKCVGRGVVAIVRCFCVP